MSVLRGKTNESLTTGKCVHERIDAQTLETPAALAIVDGAKAWTYRDLREQTDLLARLLQQRGVEKAHVIGSYMPHCAEYVIANLAIFKAGEALATADRVFPAM